MKNKLPAVIDLFCGCGGMALGFQRAGFDIAGGLDLDSSAVATASSNLDWRYGRESRHICADIRDVSGRELSQTAGESGCIVIGGPPCQAYSNIGKAKLRSLGADRESLHDARGQLYKEFLRVALEAEARAIVMENVAGSTSYGDLNVPETVQRELSAHGYDACWTILNAADFGVPQARERVFVIAVARDLGAPVDLPAPTHRPRERRKGLGNLRMFAALPGFRPPKCPGRHLPKWITVKEALSDLPSLFPTIDTKYVLRRLSDALPYAGDASGPYQELMRSWYGSDNGYVTGNCFRKTLRDYPIFERMKQGDDYVRASEIADELLREACRSERIPLVKDDPRYRKLRKDIVPPYDRTNFRSKWQRLRGDVPAYTIMAHLAVDTYSHIHPTEPRGISVREAARLQSFPDDFTFPGSMGDAFRQIGNAVPPLLAEAIARKLCRVFDVTAREEGRQR